MKKRVWARNLKTCFVMESPEGREPEDLEKILEEIEDLGLSSHTKIRVYTRMRVKNFDTNNPDYEDVPRIVTVMGLKRIYYNLTGEKYDYKTPNRSICNTGML